MLNGINGTTIIGGDLLAPWMWKVIERLLTGILPNAKPEGIMLHRECPTKSTGVYLPEIRVCAINMHRIFQESIQLMDPVKAGLYLSAEFAVSFAFVVAHEIKHADQHRLLKFRPLIAEEEEDLDNDADTFAKEVMPKCFIYGNEIGHICEVPFVNNLYTKWVGSNDPKVAFEKKCNEEGMKVLHGDLHCQTFNEYLLLAHPELAREEVINPGYTQERTDNAFKVVAGEMTVEQFRAAEEAAERDDTTPSQVKNAEVVWDDFNDGEISIVQEEDQKEPEANPYSAPAPTSPAIPATQTIDGDYWANLNSQMHSVFLLMDAHIHSMNVGDGTFANLGRIMEPLNIQMYPLASDVIKRFVTYDQYGVLNDKEGTINKGLITGRLFGNGTLPGYDLWITLPTGQRMWRRILAQNPNKTSKVAAAAREGTHITWNMDSSIKGQDGGTAFLDKIVNGVGGKIVPGQWETTPW